MTNSLRIAFLAIGLIGFWISFFLCWCVAPPIFVATTNVDKENCRDFFGQTALSPISRAPDIALMALVYAVPLLFLIWVRQFSQRNVRVSEFGMTVGLFALSLCISAFQTVVPALTCGDEPIGGSLLLTVSAFAGIANFVISLVLMAGAVVTVRAYVLHPD